MKLKVVFAFAAPVILIMLTLNSCGEDRVVSTNTNSPERHELACMMFGNVWKIVNARDTTSTRINVARGDTVVWYAPPDRDIYFQFMAQELTGVFTRELLQGENLSLVVGENAETGNHPYAVFVHGAREYATGDSPPMLIIRE